MANQIYNSAGNLALQLIIHDVRIVHQIVNQSTGIAYLDLYYCRARRDYGPTTPGATTLLQDGFALNGITSTTANSADITPFQSAAFCSLFKIYKVKNIKMDAGHERTFMVSSKRRRLIDMARLLLPTDQTTNMLNAPIGTIGLKNNKFILYRLRGQLATDTNSVTTTLITTPPKILFTTRYLAKFQYISDFRSTVYHQGAVGFTAQVGNAQIIDDQTNTIIQAQQA
jgi:hypothetical protein